MLDYDNKNQVTNTDHLVMEKQSLSFANSSQNSNSLVANKSNFKINTLPKIQ